MRKGSVRVSQGQAVKTGDVIGFVGHSGGAEFPHVHLSILHNGEHVDPFSYSDGAGGTSHLWSDAARNQMRYESVSVYAAGFREAVPDSNRVKQGNIQNQDVSLTSPAIVFWTAIFGIRTGDTIRQTLHRPGGRLLAQHEVVQKKNQIRRFLWTGKKRGAGLWPAGEYTGRTSITPADGADLRTFNKKVTINITGATGN